MARHRAFEEVTARAHADGRLPGLLHLSIGAEAATAGVFAVLGDDDRIYSAHRPHGHFLAAGESPLELFAELAGRETGLCRGRGGSMHLMGARAVMATGVVGGTLPIAVGHSLALSPGTVAVVFFGDGAVQTGIFHETLNMASLWRTPTLFVCENNARAEFTSREEHTPVACVSDYGPVYGIPALTVDGADVRAVTEAATALLEPVRAAALRKRNPNRERRRRRSTRPRARRGRWRFPSGRERRDGRDGGDAHHRARTAAPGSSR